MRMLMLRFTRLTNAFSKVENLTRHDSLHFAYYNVCRVHTTLATAPVAAGVADHIWTLSELTGLLEAADAIPIRRASDAKTRAVKRAAAISDRFTIDRHPNEFVTGAQ